MELSLYSIPFEENGKFYLYNSQTNFFSEISYELYKSLKNRSWQELPDTVVEELQQKKILVEPEAKYNYYNAQRLLFNAQKYSNTTLTLIIAPTTACNFDCPYCFEPKKNPKTLNTEIIDGIRTFIKSFREVKNIHLTWYGGEPLLAFDKIKEIHQMLNESEMPKISSVSIITNGYLFNENVIDFFKEVKLGNVQITLDGTKEHHNTTRCLKNGHKPTFDVILNNIDLILNKMPDAKLSLRVNIKKSTYKQYIELLDYFSKKYPDNKNLNVYPGLIREETADGKSLTCDCFTSEDMSELDNMVRNDGFNVNIYPKREHRGCMVHALNSYIIGPEGELYKCWNDVSNPELSVGNINSPQLTGSTRLLDFMTEATPFNAECKNCHAFPICGGGCSYFRLRNYKEGAKFSICSPYKNFEKLKKALFAGIKPEIV